MPNPEYLKQRKVWIEAAGKDKERSHLGLKANLHSTKFIDSLNVLIDSFVCMLSAVCVCVCLLVCVPALLMSAHCH